MTTMKDILWVSPRRFSATVQIPLSTVYDYLRQNKIKHHRRGGRIWISVDETREWHPDKAGYGPRPAGVVPRKYRNRDGQELRDAETACPRLEMLWGAAARNLLNSIERAAFGTDTFADFEDSYMILPQDRVLDEERGEYHRLLY